MLAAGLLLVAALPGGPHAARRDLAMAERIDCQRNIERVYHGHQQGTTRSFEEAVPDSLLERKVRTYLKQSAALEAFWSTPVTGRMLGAELARIQRQSRFPERLDEIYEALHHDPFLVMECFVRPVLVERLSRGFFDFDERIHGEAGTQAMELHGQLVRGEIDPRLEHPLRGVVRQEAAGKPIAAELELLAVAQSRHIDPDRVSIAEAETAPPPTRIGRVEEKADAFVIDAVLNIDDRGETTARYRIPKRTWDEWWNRERHQFDESRVTPVAPAQAKLLQPEIPASSLDPTCLEDDTWDNGTLTVEPARVISPGVWTGTHMLVGGNGPGPVRKYDPLTDTWTTSAAANPLSRTDATVIWTGTEMIVWGGRSMVVTVNTGARYDPTSDAWAPTSTVGAPSPRWGHSAVWDGSRMIVWGGVSTSTGGLYDPTTDSWIPTTTANAPQGRHLHSAVWTGDRMIVWGGFDAVQVFRAGAQYDPASDSWIPIAPITTADVLGFNSTVWTGSEMIVWGGQSFMIPETNIGARYNPRSDTWVVMSTENAPEGRFNHPAVWTGSEMLVWGGELLGGVVDTGGRYDPATDTWRPISEVNAPSPRRAHAAVWTGDRMVVFGGVYTDAFLIFVPWQTGGRYDPVTDTWTPTASTANGPTERVGHSVIWSGNEMIVWGGCDGLFDAYASGKRYDPLTDSWRQISMDHGLEGRCNHAAVWTGEEMLVWSGQRRFFNTSRILGDGARYDPISDDWEPMSAVGAPQGRALHSGIWTGARMIVWGGAIIGGVINSGGQYDPASDTWLPTSTLGAPEGRFFHSAVWTEEKMIVWGGDTGTAIAAYGNGGLYDPVTDTWQPTSLVGAPSPRASHAAAWTGREMFIFSGVFCAKCQPVSDGFLYDPAVDAWTPISSTNSPPAGFVQVGLWTGREVLVWGSQRLGGRYDPELDSWRRMSTIGAPPTADPRAVWTGTHMLVWARNGYGGRYVAFYPPDDDGDGVSACDGDCDDSDPATNPDAAEVCDGRDNDCDGVIPSDEADSDGDGFMVCGGDCDDARSGVNPDAPELPGNIVDENCDGELACDPRAPWKNSGQLVSCIARVCERLVDSGAVGREECDALISKSGRLGLR